MQPKALEIEIGSGKIEGFAEPQPAPIQHPIDRSPASVGRHGQ
jgi:hypothetical protein